MTKLIPIHVIFQLPGVSVLGFRSAGAREIPGCPTGAYHRFNSYPDQRSPAGNRALPRTYSLHRAPTSNRKAIPKLPINFYDKNWYASRTQAEKLELAVQKSVHIPNLIPHVRYIHCAMTAC